MAFLIDHAAQQVALKQFALPECLHVPTAAVDEAAITTYIGKIEQVLAEGSPRKAFLVKSKEPPLTDMRLPIWELPASKLLHGRRQVWVHIGFTRYRRAYRKAFPDEAIDGKVLSHALNRPKTLTTAAALISGISISMFISAPLRFCHFRGLLGRPGIQGNCDRSGRTQSDAMLRAISS